MTRIGIAGRLGGFFMESKLTPIIIAALILLGIFAIYNTPREEDPQILVPMIDIMVPYPGASAKDVETKVASVLERKMWEIPGVEYVYSTSMPGMALITVRFYVNEDEEKSLVKLYNKMMYNMDLMPKGVMFPLVKSRSIDDVPILTLTFWSKDLESYQLRRIAAEVRNKIKSINNVSMVDIYGGEPRKFRIILDPEKVAAYHLSLMHIAGYLMQQNFALTSGRFEKLNREFVVKAGPFIKSKKDLENLIVGIYRGNPIYLRNVAEIKDGPGEPSNYVFIGLGPEAAKKGMKRVDPKRYEYPAVTLAISKRKGSDAYKTANLVKEKVNQLKGIIIPSDVNITVTRNYGDTANEKVNELILHLIWSIIIVVLVVFFSMGLRTAFIVFISVPCTFAITLFIYYLHGYTLNRVTLFALIFVTGIVVDDSIIIVENIFRHFSMQKLPKRDAAIAAISEVGNPTILATFTVIASVLPMAFVRGLMGPYMRPMPVGASVAVLFSLFIALSATPWLSYHVLKYGEKEEPYDLYKTKTYKIYDKYLRPLLLSASKRFVFIAVVIILLLASISMFLFKAVIVKMLPFDNKSEFQVIIDTPEGTTLERTLQVAENMGEYLRKVSEVTDYEIYAGIAAPYNFNGLVRHYYLRRGANIADIQVNLVNKHERSAQSHDIAKRVRPFLHKIAEKYGARVKVVEVPPGPPVLSTLVAEVYGPNQKTRISVARKILNIFDHTEGVVDTDWFVKDPQVKYDFIIDREKAIQNGVSVEEAVKTLRMALSGMDVGYAHIDNEVEPVGINIRVKRSERSGIDSLKDIYILSKLGREVPLREIVKIKKEVIEQPIYHKNLKPVVYVVGEVSGKEESPIYAILRMNKKIDKIKLPGGGRIEKWYTRQPWSDEKPAMKWDGEWQITYEVFRDLGLSFGAVLVLMYILVLAWFHKLPVPLIQMISIPLSLIGIVIAHMIMGAEFTATSMIGMIALAGIVVRNSVLLIDFVDIRLAQGMDLKQAIIESGAVRFRPIALTSAAVITGAFVIVLDPIFKGLALSLMGGGVVSTMLTLVVIPVVYYMVYKNKYK